MNPTAGYRHLTSTSDKLVCCAVSYALLKVMGGGQLPVYLRVMRLSRNTFGAFRRV
ncbi:MAG: hypothetical protein LBC98_00475 [Prevotellaceae bacterium]|jgi:hypothetical protein|nr:hypothetical protein [Prevotellaceae bacterium]